MEIIRVGNKHIKNYILAAVKALYKSKELKIVARGRNNNGKAIDLAEILRRQHKFDIDIKIGSEKFDDKFVSTIEITLKAKE